MYDDSTHRLNSVSINMLYRAIGACVEKNVLGTVTRIFLW